MGAVMYVLVGLAVLGSGVVRAAAWLVAPSRRWHRPAGVLLVVALAVTPSLSGWAVMA